MSVRSVLAGKEKRRRGPRTKRISKSKRAEVKIKIKGSPSQVQKAVQKLSGQSPDKETM